MDLTLPSQWIIEAEPWQWLAIGTPDFWRRGGFMGDKARQSHEKTREVE
jgi:hypothetical protein